MMAIRWLWTALAVLMAQGAVLAADSGHVDASKALRSTREIDVLLIGSNGLRRGPDEIMAFDKLANPRFGWYGFLIATDTDEGSHLNGKIPLDISRPFHIESGINWAASKPLFAKKVSVPGRYFVRGFGRLFGEEQITGNDRLVTFTEVIQPYKVLGKVTDTAGNPVANAKIALENPGDHNTFGMHGRWGKTMKELLQPKSFFFRFENATSDTMIDEILSAYLKETTTTELGEWTISGLSMPENAVVSVEADGFEPAEFRGLFNQNRPKLPKWNDLLAGDYQTTPVKLLKQGKLRVKAEPEWMDKNRSVEIRLSANGSGAADAAWIKQSREGRFEREDDNRIEDVNQPVYYEMIVPAERAFSLVMEKTDYSPPPLNMGGTKSLFYTVEVEHPLEPGEVREIGPLDFKDASKWKASQAK